jgi:predicted alpha/beta superfamily hydrolase
MHKRHCKILDTATKHFYNWRSTIEWYKENLDVCLKIMPIQKKFSVIYMHDAQNLFDAKTSYAGEWNVDEN